jgi:hypothetical protein
MVLSPSLHQNKNQYLQYFYLTHYADFRALVYSLNKTTEAVWRWYQWKRGKPFPWSASSFKTNTYENMTYVHCAPIKIRRDYILISSKFRCLYRNFDFGFYVEIEFRFMFWCWNRNFDFGFDFDIGIPILISILESVIDSYIGIPILVPDFNINVEISKPYPLK